MSEETENLVDELIRNSSISRYRHFYEATRHSSFNSWIGVPVVVINIALGSTFFALIDRDVPEIAKLSAAGLALIAALLSGIQTFFNFSKMFEGHRKLGNRYLEIVRELEKISAYRRDNVISSEDFHERFDSLHKRYLELNEDSSDYSTSQSAMKVAFSQEELRVSSLASRKSNKSSKKDAVTGASS
jgi:hypothetical protein